MLRTVDAFLLSRSRTGLTVGAGLLVLVVGLVDQFTGIELAFSIFYLLPVALASWYAGKRVGLAICVASAVAWYVVDYTGGQVYSHPAIPIWNATVRLGFFVITTSLLVRLRAALDDQTALAEQDGLTGLLNSRAFESHCRQLFDLAARYGHPLSLGYLDLDNFKSVNDNLGHSAGDAVLKAVAGTLTERLRTSDLVGRLGGDEFAILLPETDAGGATVVFSRIHRRLLEVAADNRWPIGFSIGVAIFESPPANPDEAIRLADDLMYRVKSGERNSLLVQEFEP